MNKWGGRQHIQKYIHTKWKGGSCGKEGEEGQRQREGSNRWRLTSYRHDGTQGLSGGAHQQMCTNL